MDILFGGEVRSRKKDYEWMLFYVSLISNPVRIDILSMCQR